MIIRIDDNGTLKQFNILDDSVIAEVFDSSDTYAAGDYVIKGNGLYRFTSSHTGAWDANDVTEITITGEFGTIIDSIPSTAADVGAEPAVTEVTISDTGAVTQALDAGKIYHFTGTLTALTVTLTAASAGQIAWYHFDFDCGSTAPTVTIPNTVTMPDSQSFDANKHYEVDILNNYGVVSEWSTV